MRRRTVSVKPAEGVSRVAGLERDLNRKPCRETGMDYRSHRARDVDRARHAFVKPFMDPPTPKGVGLRALGVPL